MEKKYWIVYEKINQEGSPLTYNQRANLLLGELRNLKKFYLENLDGNLTEFKN
ncbi:MAG: hypothetical protein HOC22_05140 [Cryomorphaceae bacterium]|nr:hypothetical protein [Cryomorphaceae bacterium]MBT3503114.1 hypothetical protein [Cryomorphaceae bacterium]MBT3688924.1 hypothetical protein [Cryomorphaceae bacterium]MBT4222677.1 hypothetical protein [Cryomorphaceae bacterium]MBT4293534.1 hypothetical protein [Cryomorphaceae bacterium]